MNKTLNIRKQVLIESIVELNWIDVNLFQSGTKLGVQDATRQEAAESLLDFVTKNDIGNRIAKIKYMLRDEIAPDLKYDKRGLSELDHLCKKNLADHPPASD